MNISEYFEKLGLMEYYLVTNDIEQYLDLKENNGIDTYLKTIRYHENRDKLSDYLNYIFLCERLESANDSFYNKLLYEQMTDNFLFMDFIRAIETCTTIAEARVIEAAKNRVLRNNQNEFERLKMKFDAVSHKVFKTNYIKSYQIVNDFEYSNYIDSALEVLNETKREFKNILLQLKLKGNLSSDNVTMKVDFHWLSTKIRNFPVENESYILKKINEVFRLSTYNNFITIKNTQGMDMNVRGLCIPINIPFDIRVLIKGGKCIRSVMTYLHEIGHAFSFASIRIDLREEDKFVVNELIQETYAYLFEELIYNMKFQESIGLVLTLEEKELLEFENLYTTRLIASKFLFQEMFYNEKNRIDLLQNYSEIMEDGLLCKVDGIEYLIDSDLGRPAAQYFIGRLFSYMIKDKLLESYGESWFANSKAISKLKILWMEGSAITPKNIGNVIDKVFSSE